MGLTDIMTEARKREEYVALALAASLLTHEQIKILAHLCAGNRADAIEAAMIRTQPPKGERGGPMIPYLVGGSLEEFPFYVNDVASLLLGMFSGGGEMATAADKVSLMAANTAVGNGRAVSVGSAAFYQDKQGVWASPAGLRKAASMVPFQMLWAVQGLSEDMLGTGYQGMRPLKGTLPDSAKPASTGQTGARTVATDPTLAAAAQAAADLEKAK